MKRLILVMAVLALLGLGVTNAFAYPSPALDAASGLKDGAVTLSVPTDAPPIGGGALTGVIYTNAGAGWVSSNVWWAQPKLSIKQGTKTYDVFGICIDSINPWTGGSHPYTVGNYVPVVSTIENQAAWNKLTHLWSSATMYTDVDRAAIQLATWKVCAGDWSVGRTVLSNYWTTGDNTGYEFKVANLNNSIVLSKALGYITAINGSNDTIEVAGYKTLTNTLGKQNFATAVPEPGTILAALSILAPAAMIFRRRKSA